MPISLSALRDHCRIVGDDFDTQLTRSYYAAAYDIERRAGLLLRPCMVTMTRQGVRGINGLVLPVGPVDLDSISITDAAGDPVTGWDINYDKAEPTLCVTDYTQFEVNELYTVTYSAGLQSIPHDLMIAVLELAAHHFENREATAPIQLHAVPSSVWSIVANYGRGKV